MAYRKEKDEANELYSQKQVTKRHESRVWALERTAYLTGVLVEIPKEETQQPNAPRGGEKKELAPAQREITGGAVR